MSEKITWKLVEVDKEQIRKNPNNPKVRNDKGFEYLKRVTKKFGFIYDGILNADYSLIDGHSRLELNPEGTGMYFMPSEQISDKDEKELNALFDLAQAGDPDMFIIEHVLGDEFIKEVEEEVTKKKGPAQSDLNAKYPLVPQFDEKYEAIIIMCTNTIDTTFIKNALRIDKAMSYKNKMVKETSVITAKQFIEVWKSK